PDLARALARLVVGRGGPRDLAVIRDAMAASASLADKLAGKRDVPAETAEAAAALQQPDPAIARELAAALAEELPHLKRDGGFVPDGYDRRLDEAGAVRDGARDEARALREDPGRVVAALQTRYAEPTGVRTLKVK